MKFAVFSANRWDRRNRADTIESVTPCHDAQVVGSYGGSNPLESQNYTTALQHHNTSEHLYLAKCQSLVSKSHISLHFSCWFYKQLQVNEIPVTVQRTSENNSIISRKIPVNYSTASGHFCYPLLTPERQG